jgi:hypothetical protein
LIDVRDSAGDTILSVVSVAAIAASISIVTVAIAITFIPVAVPVAIGPFPVYLIAATFELILEIVEYVTIRRKTRCKDQRTRH